MPTDAPFGSWMVAIAEAAETAGIEDLDAATAEELTRAWGLVGKAAGLEPGELALAVAREANLPVAELAGAQEHALHLLPAAVAHRTTTLPLSCDAGEIAVATANPLSEETRRELAEVTGRVVDFRVAPPDAIAEAVVRRYGPRTAELDYDGPPGRTPHPPGAPHVLVVDDEAGQRALCRAALEHAGFRVDVAPDGPAAVELLAGDPSYDLVTLDYWMDRMNGLRVLQKIRSDPTTRDLPVVMVTGADDRRIEMSLFEAGADDYIAKPIDGPLFVLRVRAVLRRRAHLSDRPDATPT